MKTYKVIDHTADLGVYYTAKTVEEGFEAAGWILFDLMADIPQVNQDVKLHVSIDAKDIHELMINWLNELIYHFETKMLLFNSFKISQFSDTHLEAQISGEKIDINKHHILKEIKAATYHQLEITSQDNDLYFFKIIFDI